MFPVVRCYNLPKTFIAFLLMLTERSMLKVKQIMSKPVITVTSDTLVKDASALLAVKNISGVPVVDGQRIVGVFSEADVLRSLKTTKKDLKLIYPSISSLGIAFQEEVTQREIIDAYNEVGMKPVKEVMSQDVDTVGPEMTLNEVIGKMVQKGVITVPVVDKGTIVGVVTRGDVIRGLAIEQPQATPRGL
jgi:CBS domain-containing protein